MSKPRLLSGEEIVAKGATKASVSLPEIGLKDVKPNGSWLELKQIQSALDARKHLIEVERIEKCGNISHAQWREDLMLAEVIKQTGGYWQYLGHHRGKVLYLKPEEALYLMEVNCLHLKYNDVTVSLQQAYSLLLRGQVSRMHYKVYASLSRLGYKIFRFSESKVENKIQSDCSMKDETNVQCNSDANITDTINIHINKERKSEEEKTSTQNVSNANKSAIIISENDKTDVESKMDTSENATALVKISQNDVNKAGLQTEINKECEKTEVDEADANKIAISDETMEIDSSENLNRGEETVVSNDTVALNHSNNETSDTLNTATDNAPSNSTTIYKNKNQNMMHKLLHKRHLRSHSAKDLNKFFENIPDLIQKDSVTVIVPTENLPDNVKPRYASYEVNLNIVRTKNVDQVAEPATSMLQQHCTSSRLESITQQDQGYNNQTYIYSNIRFQRQPVFNQFPFWRPRQSWNSYAYNMIFQRPFMRNAFYASRYQFIPRPPTYFRSFNFSTRPVNIPTRPIHEPNIPVHNTTDFTMNGHSSHTNSRKRPRDHEQDMRLNTIKNLASNLKSKRFQISNNIGLVNFLHNLINIYNLRYHAKIRLTDDLDIDKNENIVDTIDLDDDEVAAKKPKNDDSCKFEENFSRIQQLASKLKDLESNELATPQYRRALSSVVRTFNESFNADIHVTESYDVVDRRRIILDSSSESDCVIKETEIKKNRKKVNVGKIVRNPFNLLKTLSEKNTQIACCSKDSEVLEITSDETEEKQDKEYSEEFKRLFKSWLPKSNDFGRAEVVPKSLMLSRIIEDNRQSFLFDFIKNHTCKFINWLDVKISFLETMEYAASLFQDDHVMENSDWQSIVKPEDCKDMPSILKKLSIISNNSDVHQQTRLRIDFDVYNRDVQNFRKSNLPKPHFRIICVKQSSGLPDGADVAALHAQHDDAPIVFAVVGESISYLQIKPANLPVYIPEGEPA